MPWTDDVTEFGRRLNGDLLLPLSCEYERVRQIFNRRVDRRPALIARCRGAIDVVRCVQFARAHGLPVSVKGGGHGPTGSAVRDDGLLIDLSLMRGVWVDPMAHTAAVQAGALWKDVYREAEVFGLVPPGGSCDMVGVAGATLGGGWGYLSRSQGLAVDNLDAVQLVTADGQLVTASLREHPDLFWALRGGGGGNFGVVTGFEYRLHALAPQVYAGEVIWPYDKAARVLAAYRDYLLSGAPNELYVDINLYWDQTADGVTEKAVSISAVYVGSEAGGRRALRPFVEIPGASSNDLRMRSYVSYLEAYAAELHAPMRELWKSAFLERRISPATIDTIVERFDRQPGPPSRLLFIETVGGAIDDVKPKDTAYPHRGELMCLTLIGSWEDPAQDEAMETWVREFRTALEPGASGGVYINYPDADLPDWPTAYYRDNYRRLVDVKDRYDPGHFFHFPQSIGS